MGFEVTDKKIIIIGCGASGGTAAQFARKTDRKASITIVEQGKYSQYSKCGLPYTVSGEIPNVYDLIEYDSEWFKKEKIELLLNSTVSDINTKSQSVTIQNDTETIEKKYDTLIFCTGAFPFVPPIKNINTNDGLADNVFSVRTIDDVKNISSKIKKDMKATIIGAGLIGLEMADCLYKKGLKITIIEALPQILANNMDEDTLQPILSILTEKTTLYTNHIAVQAKQKNDKVTSIIIQNQKDSKQQEIDTDIVIIATGTKPNVSLAEKIGCTIGKTGGIVVNQQAQTSLKDVYAAGDCTQYNNSINDKPTLIGLGSIAVRQAIAAGINAAGKSYELPKGVLLTRTSEFFGIEIAAVGLDSNASKDIPMIYAKLKGSSKPPYFPGGEPIVIKIGIHEKTGVILAAQAVGSNAAQRINTFACAIQNKVNVEDFRKLETAYAPPIAPTLDVITLVCDIASRKFKGKNR
jgi:NADH oxidase (H2O2-forming)